jgi:hypothetical protein
VTVTPLAIVERIDVFRNVRSREISILVNLLLDTFFLQAAEEGLRYHVVPAVTFTAHARLEMIRATKSPPGVTAVLCSLIRVDQSLARPPATYRHDDGIQYDLAVNRRAYRPADNFP